MAWLKNYFHQFNTQAKLILLLTIIVVTSPLSGTAESIKFTHKTIYLNSKPIRVEIADNEEKRKQGLMYRKFLPENEGMLFVFSDSEYRSFWMKNTFINLSIAFFNDKKILVEFVDLLKAQSEMQLSVPSYISKEPAMYVLEMNQGWFKKNKINLNAKLRL